MSFLRSWGFVLGVVPFTVFAIWFAITGYTQADNLGISQFIVREWILNALLIAVACLAAIILVGYLVERRGEKSD